MGIQETIISKWSRPSPLLVATAAATVFVIVPTLRVTLLSRRLSQQISYHLTLIGDDARVLFRRTSETISQQQGIPHESSAAQSDRDVITNPTSRTQALERAALPDSLKKSPDAHNIFYDISSLNIDASTLPPGLLRYPEDLLTAYLQHTMTLFARTPQAWILWTVAALSGDRQARRSFEREWIESMGFEAGELVNGLYYVKERHTAAKQNDASTLPKDSRVVFEMTSGPIEGRLVVSVMPSKSSGDEVQRSGKDEDTQNAAIMERQSRDYVVFSTETWMWVNKDAGVVMPMERTVPRYMHRLASGWLLLEGTKWLQNLGK